MLYNFNQVCVFLHLADSAGVCTGVRGQCWCHVIWCGASSISIRKVSMGVSPMSLKKNRCSRHLRPMERRAGRRSSNLANLPKWREKKKKKITHHFYWIVIHFQSSFILFPTCLAGRGISVSCMTPAMRKPFPLAPQPLVGLKDLWHLTTQSGQMLLGHVVTLMGVFDGDPPGLKRTMARRQPSSVLSISMSFILDTSSVRTLHDRKAANMETKRRSQEMILHLFATYLSKIEPTPALWALLRWTWRPVASRMPSFTVTERCEKEAMRSSFQPEYKGKHSDSHSTYF